MQSIGLRSSPGCLLNARDLVVRGSSCLPLNIFVLRVIQLPLQHWTPLLQGHLKRIRLDNATAVTEISHQGGTRSHCSKGILILSWAELHIPALSPLTTSEENWQADFLSQLLDLGEQPLHLKVFQALCHRWGTPDIRFKNKMGRYVVRSSPGTLWNLQWMLWCPRVISSTESMPFHPSRFSLVCFAGSNCRAFRWFSLHRIGECGTQTYWDS